MKRPTNYIQKTTEMLTLMAYYYCNLSKYERSHISYITGAMYNLKYNNIPKTPMQDLAYKRLKDYFGEWHKLIGHEIKKPLEDEIKWAIDGKKGQAQSGKTKPRANGEVNSK